MFSQAEVSLGQEPEWHYAPSEQKYRQEKLVSAAESRVRIRRWWSRAGAVSIPLLHSWGCKGSCHALWGWSGCFSDKEPVRYHKGRFVVSFRTRIGPRWGSLCHWGLLMGLNGRMGFDLIKVRVSEANWGLSGNCLAARKQPPCNDYCIFGLVIIALSNSRSASGVTSRGDKGAAEAGNHWASTDVWKGDDYIDSDMFGASGSACAFTFLVDAGENIFICLETCPGAHKKLR